MVSSMEDPLLVISLPIMIITGGDNMRSPVTLGEIELQHLLLQLEGHSLPKVHPIKKSGASITVARGITPGNV